MYTMELEPRLQKQVDMNIPGTDILHGELKNLIYEAEQELIRAQEIEDETEEAMDSMERKYWEGQIDGLSHVYALTYALAFAISERTKKNG
jgi:hypothetical protein